MSLSFGDDGWLRPAGPSIHDSRTVEQFLVFNAHRRQLWEQFKALLYALSAELIVVHDIWLDGSFVSTKPTPNDLDVVIFIDLLVLNRRYVDLDNLRNQFTLLDVHWASVSSEADALAQEIARAEQGKWHLTFGFDRKQKTKGYIQFR